MMEPKINVVIGKAFFDDVYCVDINDRGMAVKMGGFRNEVDAILYAVGELTSRVNSIKEREEKGRMPLSDKKYRGMLEDLHQGKEDFSEEDLIGLTLWMEKQHEILRKRSPFITR